MRLPEIIESGLDYIERNVKTAVTAEELAQMAGYSTYHYCRLFSSVTASSVAGYIKARRLDHALAEIAGGRKAIDVVLEYGFETYAGFYKAFVKAYGCSPKKYLSIHRVHSPIKPEVADGVYSQKELRTILGNWNLGGTPPIQDIFLMDGAKVSGNVWKVGEEYILKTCPRDGLVRNAKVARALAARGFAASVPIKTTAGADFTEGEPPFSLTRGLPGAPLSSAKPYAADAQGLGRTYGQSIAHLHRALADVERAVSPDETNLYQTVADWALPNVRKQNEQRGLGLEDAFFDEYLRGFGALHGKLRRQLIHSDLHPSNILFVDEAVSGFIDFEASEINVRLWDVCYCATGMLCGRDEAEYDGWFDFVRGILRGYDAVSKLTAEEKQAVFDVICSIQMIFIAYCQGQEKLKPLAETNRRMLRFIAMNRQRLRRIGDQV